MPEKRSQQSLDRIIAANAKLFDWTPSRGILQGGQSMMLNRRQTGPRASTEAEGNLDIAGPH